MCYGAASFLLLVERLFCFCSLSMVHRATVAILLSWWTVSALLSSLLLYLAGYSTRLLHLLQQPSCFWDLVMVGVKIWEIIPKCFRYFLLKIPSHPSLTVPDLCTIFFLDFRDSVLVVSAWFCSFGWWILRCV